MPQPNKHDTGLKDPGKLARRLLATLLPVIELNCNDDVSKEVMRAADGCVSAYQRLIRVLMMHHDEISSSEDKSQALKITRDEVFRQMNNPDITPDTADSYRNYLMHLDRLIEAHDGGWRQRMFPISPEAANDGNALKTLAQDKHIYVYCQNRDCAEYDAQKEISIAYLTRIKGGNFPLQAIKYKCSSCSSTNVSKIAPWQVFHPNSKRGND